MLKPTPMGRSLDGLHPLGRLAWVVRFGACEHESDIPATSGKLADDLIASLKHRRRDDPVLRVEKATEARAAIAEVAEAGRLRRECRPGDPERLLAFLDEHPHGFLVMVSAHAAVGRDSLVLPKEYR
jgi:hypothetical protein